MPSSWRRLRTGARKPGVIWAIATGAFLLTLAIGLVLVVLYCRLKQRRQLARIFSARERRLSGYPGGHLSITDEDVARMPGTRRARRNSSHAPSKSSRGWTAISSRESLPRRPVKTASKHPQNTIGTVPIWPLPRRLTRSTASPSVKLNASLQSPKQDEKIPESHKLPGLEFNVLCSRDLADNTPSSSGNGQETSTASAPKVKPSFNSKQRSISAGLILQRPEGEINHVEDSLHPGLPGPPHIPTPHLPRSASLCSQHAGTVPTKPIPPLPFNLPATNRFQNIRKLIEENSTRASGNSLLSGDTSILDDCLSRTLSQAETSLTSTSVLSPVVSSSLSARAGVSDTENQIWRSSNSGHPPQVSKKNEPQARADVRKSCRASIVQSLPRSASSGLSLSLSLAAGSSRNESSTSLYRDKILPSRTPSLMVPDAMEGRGKRRGKSPASPLRNSTTFDSRGDLKADPKTPSTLQVISGNEGGTETSKSENFSPSDENTVFQWDPASPMQPGKPSVAKDRAKGHLRQTDLKIKKSGESNVRISDIPLPALPLASSPVGKMSSEPAEHKIPPFRPSSLSNGLTLPRPPTRVTFDPQIISNPYPKFSHHVGCNNDSPTLSSIFQYEVDNKSSSESVISSPSPRRRTPTHQRLPGSNPNRSKPVFSIPGEGHWSIMNFENSFTVEPTKPALDTAQAKPQASEPIVSLPQSSSGSASSQPCSFLYPIPSEHDMPARRRSPGSSPIRGPRAAPGRHSPTRGIGKPLSYGIIGSSRDLRKSVMALRRQNSEAQNSPLQEHRNYLDINIRSERPLSGLESDPQRTGDLFTAVEVIMEGEGREYEGSGEKTRPENTLQSRKAALMMDPSIAKGSRRNMLEQNIRPESPGTLYDSSGFLKE